MTVPLPDPLAVLVPVLVHAASVATRAALTAKAAAARGRERPPRVIFLRNNIVCLPLLVILVRFNGDAQGLNRRCHLVDEPAHAVVKTVERDFAMKTVAARDGESVVSDDPVICPGDVRNGMVAGGHEFPHET